MNFDHRISIFSREGFARHELGIIKNAKLDIDDMLRHHSDLSVIMIRLGEAIKACLVASSELRAIADHPDLEKMF